MTSVKPTTDCLCIVVVTKVGAQVFERLGPRGRIALRSTVPHLGGRACERELVTDRAGRSDSPTRRGGSPLLSQVDTKHHSLRQFLRSLCDELNRCAYSEQFTGLVLVADAPLLGEIRNYLGSHAQKLLLKEIEKDLGNIPQEEMAARIAAHLDE